MSRVTEQGDPTAAPPGKRVAVGHRVLQHGFGPADEVYGVEPAEVPPLEMTKHPAAVAGLVPLGVTGQWSWLGLGQHHHPVDLTAADRVDDEVDPVAALD